VRSWRRLGLLLWLKVNIAAECLAIIYGPDGAVSNTCHLDATPSPCTKHGMKHVYGKKTRTITAGQFLDLSPAVGRSPRIRKVLEEKSANVQEVHLEAAASPCPQDCSKPIKAYRVKESKRPVQHVVALPPVHKQPVGQLRSEDVASTEEDGLTAALKQLAVAERETDPSSKTAKKARSSKARETTACRHPDEALSLSIETATYIAPLLSCKSVSQSVSSFSSWLSARTTHLSFTKIGEGSYGQVFRATSLHPSQSKRNASTLISPPTRSENSPSTPDTVIIKLIPLNAANPRAARYQSFTSIPSAATEVQLLSKMQAVPGFVEFRGACLLQGAMPEELVRLWTEYLHSGRTVESRDPRARASYLKEQLWLVLELSDAGVNLEDLERGRGLGLPNVISRDGGEEGDVREEEKKEREREEPSKGVTTPQAWDIFWQTALALAKSELYCAFEHRDLHLGNICVRQLPPPHPPSTSPPPPPPPDPSTPASAAIPTPISISSTGLLVTLIDYTLSRASSTAAAGAVLAYDFLADEALLAGDGDLQYAVYRRMRNALDGRAATAFEPRTNLLWLHHLLVKLRAATVREEGEVTTKMKKETGARRRKKLGGRERDQEAVSVEARMGVILERVRLDLGQADTGLWAVGSASELLQLALEDRWIAVGDELGS